MVLDLGRMVFVGTLVIDVDGILHQGVHVFVKPSAPGRKKTISTAVSEAPPDNNGRVGIGLGNGLSGVGEPPSSTGGKKPAVWNGVQTTHATPTENWKRKAFATERLYKCMNSNKKPCKMYGPQNEQTNRDTIS